MMLKNKRLLDHVEKYEAMGIFLPSFAKFKQLMRFNNELIPVEKPQKIMKILQCLDASESVQDMIMRHYVDPFFSEDRENEFIKCQKLIEFGLKMDIL